MNRIAKNFIINGLSSLLSQLVTFVTITYYAQEIGKDYFGSITLAQQIIVYFSIAVIFGLQTLGVRIISNSTKTPKEAVTQIVSFRLLIAAASFIILVTSSLFMSSNYSFGLVLTIFSTTLFPIAMNLDWLFIGFQRMHHNAVYNLCRSVLPGIIILIFLEKSSNLYIIPLAMLIGLIIGTTYQYIIARVMFNITFKFKFDYINFKALAMLAFPFLTSGLLAMVNTNVDKLIIGFSRSSGELGVYQAAYTFISFFITLESLVFIPIFPAMINLYKKKEFKRLKELCEGLAKYIMILVMPITLGGLVLSKDIIRFVYGEEYISAYLPFNILLVYIFILYCREVYAYGLNAWNGEVKYLKTVSISAALNALLCVIFVPKFGYISAAIITTATEVINLVLMRRDSNKIIKIKLSKNYLIILPATIMIIFTYMIKRAGINFILNIFLSMLIYLSLLFALRLIKVEEIKALIIKK